MFPLPGVTLFPGIVLPRHVYEERYRALVDDALDGDGLVAMAVLKPGWGPDYSGRPPIDEAICLGRILTYNRLSDGRYNLLLAGMRRARILSESPPKRSAARNCSLRPKTTARLPTSTHGSCTTDWPRRSVRHCPRANPRRRC